MNAQTAKITPGPWRYEHAAGHAYDCIRGSESVHIRGNLDIPGTNSWSDRICENLGGDTPTVRANIALICEAGTVANETGLTPQQLADQRAELLSVAYAVFGACDQHLITNTSDADSVGVLIDCARKAIARATGEQP